MIHSGLSRAYLDFALVTSDRVANKVAVMSYFDRSLINLKSVAANLSVDSIRINYNRYDSSDKPFETYITPIVYGKEKFYHAVSINPELNKTMFITSPGFEGQAFHNFLMNNYNLPLLREWADVLLVAAIEQGYVLEPYFKPERGKYSTTRVVDIPVQNTRVDVDDLRVYQANINEEQLSELLQECLRSKLICISKDQMNSLEFEKLDDYFKNYGYMLVENLQKQIEPLTGLNGNIDCMTLNNMRLFPQQAVQVNGLIELLEKSRYGILNMGMGTGKTIVGTSIAEGFYVSKYLKESGKTLKDAYESDDVINYRHIVMCPGHLVEKWAGEIRREVPYAKVTILNDFSQLIDIRKAGEERNGKEWFIIGKDFAKLSYESIPTPSRIKKRYISVRVCDECETILKPGVECNCGCLSSHIKESTIRERGLVCVDCGNLLLPFNATINISGGEDEITKPLLPSDFAWRKASNAKCAVCGEELWRANVRNINMSNEFHRHAARNSKWHKVTHYANKSHKSRKTVWVHSDYKEEYFSMIREKPLSERSPDRKGPRKVSPVRYISKYLRGYFDFFILDEAHLFKGGSTAQGNAMHSLVKASKKQLALTGTIVGGMANHLFYLLFRLDPNRMISKGFEWTDEMAFATRYGTVERKYLHGDTEYNSNSRGRQMGSPKMKPGISPLIFSEYLLDKTVFLDLSDMSKYLPDLREKVVTVPIPPTHEVEEEDGSLAIERNPEYDMFEDYVKVIEDLKEQSRAGEGLGALSKMLQFSLSYLDKPYGVSPVISTKNGAVITKPEDYSCLVADGKLLSKEQKLVDIVNEEQAEGRNMVIYCEFTGSPETCVTYRIKDIIEKHCNLKDQVTIIESRSPKASKREEWMHKKAEEGTRVFITNPKNVETGLDFCWESKGKKYNYPTLIFYQLGYSLFTVSQASRRSYRLNQTQECRTYYMAYEGTVQETVIEAIADKAAASNAIQGKFSSEGLAAMSKGVDVKVKIAQALSDMDKTHGNDLQKMFDIVSQDSDGMDLSDINKMKIFSELVKINDNDQESTSINKRMEPVEAYNNFINHFFNAFKSEEKDVGEDDSLGSKTNKIVPSKRAKRQMRAGQSSLFDLF